MKKVITAVCMSMFFVGNAFAWGLPSLPGVGGGAGDALVADAKKLIAEVEAQVEAMNDNFVDGYTEALLAFGLNIEAEKYAAEAKQLKSGTLSGPDKDKGYKEINAGAQKAIDAKIQSKAVVSDEGKGHLSKSLASLGKGVLKQAALTGVTVLAVKKTVEVSKSGDPIAIASIAVPTAYLVYLNKDLPGNLISMKKTLGVYCDYAKSQNVDTTKEVTPEMLASN